MIPIHLLEVAVEAVEAFSVEEVEVEVPAAAAAEAEVACQTSPV